MFSANNNSPVSSAVPNTLPPPFPLNQSGSLPFLPYSQLPPPHFQGGTAPPSNWNSYMLNSSIPYAGFPPPYYYNGNFSPFPPNTQSFNQKRQRGGHYNHSNKKRKVKDPVFIDYCDVCDRGFKNLEKKEQHFSEHTKCNEPGCSFEAHFKIVEIHRRNTHGPGGVCIKLDTPEDVLKWREERRKKFPTASRIQEKEKEHAERRCSGAVLQTQSFGKFHQRDNNHRFNQGRHGRGHGRRNEQRNSYRNFVPTEASPLPKTIEKELPITAKLASDKLVYERSRNPMDLVVQSDGTSQNDPENSGDEASDITKPVMQSSGKSCSSLSQLMSNYGSDDSSEAESGDEENCKKDCETTAVEFNKVPEPTNVTKSHKTGTDAGESSNTTSSERFNKLDLPKSLHRNQRKQHRNDRNKRPFCSRLSRPSLLQMLLEPEIRQERNDILQCVRYIVRSKFFDED